MERNPAGPDYRRAEQKRFDSTGAAPPSPVSDYATTDPAIECSMSTLESGSAFYLCKRYATACVDLRRYRPGDKWLKSRRYFACFGMRMWTHCVLACNSARMRYSVVDWLRKSRLRVSR